MVLNNIRQSFPSMSMEEAKAVRKEFYHHFSDLLIESIKSASMSQAEFQKRYRFINKYILDEYHQKGKSVIILSPHTGNWEWIFSIVGIIPYDVYAVYQKLTNPYMDDYIKATRQRFDAMMTSNREIFEKINAAVDQDKQFLIWMAADQACKPEKAKWVNFLNQETTFHQGFEHMARDINCPVFFMDINKVGRSNYELNLHLIAEEPGKLPEGAIVEEFAKRSEDRIKEKPAYWLWSHNRWKHKKKTV